MKSSTLSMGLRTLCPLTSALVAALCCDAATVEAAPAGSVKDLRLNVGAHFTQVWAIVIFSGRKEAPYGVNTGGATFMPFLRTGHWGKPFDVRPARVTALSRPDDHDWALHMKAKR